MYEKFLNYFTDYIFVKDEPQKADVIVPHLLPQIPSLPSRERGLKFVRVLRRSFLYCRSPRGSVD